MSGGERATDRIRLASVSDAAAVAAIYAPHCREGAASFETEPPSSAAMAERIRATIQMYPWLVAVDGLSRRVIGYAYASRHRERAAYRWSVDVTAYLAGEAVSKGLGGQMYARLLAILTAQGFHRAYAGIALPNPASVALHRSCGFEPVGVFPEVGFKHGSWRDVQWWSRRLRNTDAPLTEPTPLGTMPHRLVSELLAP
jgi:phosphinothricin acetyltransferase